MAEAPSTYSFQAPQNMVYHQEKLVTFSLVIGLSLNFIHVDLKIKYGEIFITGDDSRGDIYQQEMTTCTLHVVVPSSFDFPSRIFV